MLQRRKANSDTIIDVQADIEEYFTADSGNSTIIPLGYNWKTLGIQVSGGLDSALLLFLTATAFKKHNITAKIQPISVFIPTKAKNIASTEKIIELVRNRTGADFINDGIVVNMPMDQTSTHDGKKDAFFNKTINSFFMDKKIDFDFNGNTKNPPESVRKYFKNDEYRQQNRDSANSIYNAHVSASPHYFMDKADIVNLYKKFDLINDLAPLTVSCDENISTIDRLKSPVPCGTCWWCSERNYGFITNNIKDPAPILSYEEYSKLEK